MSKTIRNFMTQQIHSIASNMTIKKANEMMLEYNFRHLPVRQSGKLVGVISDRDIQVAIALSSSSNATVGDFMNQDVLTLSADASLKEAAVTMAEKKVGALIITNNRGEIEGILSYVDILRALGDGSL